MANHGTLSEYDMQEDWSEYIGRLEFYFEANGVSDGEKQRAILLSVCGSKARFPLGEFVRATRSENKNPAT